VDVGGESAFDMSDFSGIGKAVRGDGRRRIEMDREVIYDGWQLMAGSVVTPRRG
jgi:hypothetical protein